MDTQIERPFSRLHARAGNSLPALCISALGIVYGDIGTSPLYTVHEIFAGAGNVPLNPANLVGAASTVVWALVLVVCLKYVTLIMRAGNHGEGGIMALLSLAVAPNSNALRKAAFLTLLGAVGAALFYGDGVITPAISVLSAVEGIKLQDPAFAPYVVPVAVGVLIALFVLQHRGTKRVGQLFGPVMALWFLVLGVGGVASILKSPAILAALDPTHAWHFLVSRGWGTFAALGAIVLALTGAEALYADMGHFGRAPIRLMWFGLVFPSLVLNYLGQAALLMASPQSLSSPFYLLYPRAALYPMIILASAATIIASQAVISGAFSMTQQAIQMGLLPRMRIVHTSAQAEGQVYVPVVNWLLFVAVMLAVIAFGSSTRLASAYGIAVTGTMIITTLLTFFVIHDAWGYWRSVSIAATGFFLVVDGAFFFSNLMKIASGGWFPIAIACALVIVMSTWRRGRRALVEKLRATQMPLEQYMARLPGDLCRAPGAAVYLVANPAGVPRAFVNNLTHNAVRHQTTIFLSVSFAREPFVGPAQRLRIENVSDGFWRMFVTFGFMERPDLLETLEMARQAGLAIDVASTSFFVSRDDVAPDQPSELARWRLRLFGAMTRLAGGAFEYMSVPAERVVELGTVIRI